MRKVKNHSGETILEVLISLLIATFCIAFFITSLVTINRGAKEERFHNSFSFQYSAGEEDETLSSGNNISVGGSSAFHADVYKHNGYYYVKVQ